MQNKFPSKITMNLQTEQQAQQQIVKVSKSFKTNFKMKPMKSSRKALDPTRRTTYK